MDKRCFSAQRKVEFHVIKENDGKESRDNIEKIRIFKLVRREWGNSANLNEKYVCNIVVTRFNTSN